ncbi:MAG: ABC transporter permease [Anaerolineae bacterium]|nr:ABC transporter permease [Gloeobacterales cyanobacterium ES-bin-313]
MFWQQIGALTWKEFKILITNKGTLILLFVMPVIFLFVMTLALDGLYNQNNLPKVAIFNQDRGSLSKDILAEIGKSNSLEILTFRDRNEANQSVVRQQSLIAIIFPKDFSQAAKNGGTITLISDPTAPLQVIAPLRGIISGTVERSLGRQVVIGELNARISAQIKDPESRQKLLIALGDIQIPHIQFDELSTGTAEPRPNSRQQNVPAWTIFGIFFIVGTLGLSFLQEQQAGTFMRLRTVPLSPVVLLLGKLLPFYLINLLQAALLFILGIAVLHLEPGTEFLALFIITLETAAVATSLGLLLATYFQNTEQLNNIANVGMVILAALGGILVPLHVMPAPLKLIARLTPQYWALVAYQDILLRGKHLPEIWLSLTILFLFAFCCFGLAVGRLRNSWLS